MKTRQLLMALLLSTAMFHMACSGASESELAELAGAGDDEGDGEKTASSAATLGGDALVFNPQKYDFGSSSSGADPIIKVFAVTNVSSTPVYVAEITGNENKNFAIVSHECPITTKQTIEAGEPVVGLEGEQSCEVQVSFTPSGEGDFSWEVAANFGVDPNLAQFTSVASVTGKGVVPLDFQGLKEINLAEVTTSRVLLEWEKVEGASSYEIYNVDESLETPIGLAESESATYRVSGLIPNQTYRFQVFAINELGIRDTNEVVREVTMDNIPTFTAVPTFTAPEGGTGSSDDLGLYCTDDEGNKPTSIVIASQTEVDTNCTVTDNPFAVQCSPGYRTGHADWSGQVAVKCFINDYPNALERTLDFTVTDTNRAPEIAAIAPQSGLAGVPISTIDVNGADDQDADLDALTYSCKYDTNPDGAVSGAASNCTDLLNLGGGNLTLNAGTGEINWTPLMSDATQTFEFEITADDGYTTPLQGTRIFTIAIGNPPPHPSNSILTVSNPSVSSGNSVTVTLNARDALNNNIIFGGETITFGYSGGTSTANFGTTTDNGDGTYTAVVTGYTSGTATSLTANINGTAFTGGMPTLTVSPGSPSPSQSIVTMSGTTVASGSTLNATLTTRDAAGNNVTSGGSSITWTRENGTSTGTFNTLVDVGDGTYTAVFEGQIAGTPTDIRAAIGGIPVTTSAPQVTVTPGPESEATSTVEILGSPSTVASDSAVNVRLNARDAAGNVITTGGRAITFITSGGTSTGTFGTTTDNGDGTYTTTFTGNTSGTAIQIIGQINGTDLTYATSTAPSISVVPGPLSMSASSVTVSSGTVNSGSTVTATLTVRDANNNVINSGGITVAFNHANGSSTGTFSGTTNNGDGTYTAVFTGVTSGTPTDVSATIDAVPVASAAPTVQVNPGPTSVADSVVTLSAPTVQSASFVVATLTLRDAAGNLTGENGQTVVFNASGGTSTGTFAGTIDNGDGTYTSNFTGVVAGTALNIGANLNATPITSTLPTLAVLPGPASIADSLITVSSGTVPSGTTITATVQVKDSNGNDIAVGGEDVDFTTAGGTSTGSFANSGNATDNSNGTYTIEFTGLVAGTPLNIGATIGGAAITSGDQPVAVVPGPIDTSTSLITVSSATVAAGSTVTITLRSKDAGGNNLTAGGQVVVFAHSGGTSTGTISGTTDQTDGTYTATFTGNTAGSSTTITATIGGTPVTSFPPNITVNPGPISVANSLVTISAPTVQSGSTVNVTLTAYDVENNLIPTGGETVAFSISGGTSTGSFGSVNDNSDGTYSATFTGLNSGTATNINATINAVPVTSTTPTVGVIPGPVSLVNSLVTVSSPTVVSNNTITVTMTTRDANNNLIGSGGNAVAFSTTGGTSTGTFATITDNGDGTYTSIFTGIASGIPTNIASTIDSNPVTSTQPAVTVLTGPIDVSESIISVSATTVASGNSINVTLTGKDINGNDLSSGGDTIVFNRSGGTATGTFSAVTDNTNGTYSATFTGVSAGTATTIGGTINAIPVSSTLPDVTVTPGNSNLAQSTITLSAASLNSGSQITATLTTRDAAGNDLTGGGLTVTFNQSGGTSAASQGSVTDHLDGTYTVTLTGTTSGTATSIGAQINGSNITSTLPTMTVNPGPISLSDTTVTVSAGTVNSGNDVTLTLTAFDAAGNRVTSSGDTVVFTHTGGTSTGSIASTTDNGNGTYEAVFTGQASGTQTTINATLNAASVTSVMPTVIVNVGALSLSQSTVSVSSNTVAATESITLTATLRDAFGNQFSTGGQTVVFNRSGGTSTGVISSTTDNGDGTYTATFTGNASGTATNISATVGGSPLASATQAVTVVPGNVSVSQSTVTTSNTSIVSGTVATLTLQAKDANGNNILTGTETVTFSHSGGTSTGTFNTVSDNADGTYTVEFTGITAGTATTINAFVNGVPVTSTLPTIGVSPGAYTLTQSELTVSATSLQSGGTINVTLQLKDANSNNLLGGGETVGFTHAGGTSTGNFSPVTDNGNGTYTATFTGVTAGSATTINATINAAAVTSTLPDVTVNPGPFSLTNSGITVSAPTVKSAEAITATVTVRDSNNNQHLVGGLTIAFSNSGGTSTGTFSSITDNGNGTYTATFTGLTSGTNTNINATINGSSVTSGSPTVQVNPGDISLAESYITVSTGTLASGASANLTLHARDANSNDLTAGGATVVFTRTGGTSTGIVGSTTDNTDGTYTATFTGVTAGTATDISATIGGAPITSTLPQIVVIPGPVSLSDSVITLGSSTVASGSAVTMTLTLRDANNNQLASGGSTVAFTNVGGSSTGTISSTTDNADGTYTATFSGIVAGTATTINADVDASAITSTLPTLTVLPGPASLSNSSIVIVGSPANVQAGSSVNVIATLRDANNNQLTLGGSTVVFNLSGGSSTGSFGSVTDNNDGTYDTQFTGLLIGTAVNIGANVDGSPIASALPSITVVPGPISPAMSLVSVSAANVQSGSAVNVTLTARDGGGNLITSGGETIVFSRSSGTSTGSFGGVTDNGNGTYSDTFTGVVAGTATTINATINGSPVTSTLPTVIVTPGAQSNANSIVSVSNPTVPSGLAITVTLQARDTNDNNLTTGGGVVTFGNSGGTSTGAFSGITDNGDGTYVATFTGANKGTATNVTATFDGPSVTTSMPTITVLEGLISKDHSTINLSSPTVASGSQVTITLQAKDANGNDKTVGGSTVSFNNSGGASTGTIGTVTDNTDGTYTAVFTGLVSGSATAITAEIDGQAVTTGNPTLTVTPGPYSLAQSVITLSSTTVASGNVATMTLQARDANNNNLTAGGLTVVFSNVGGSSTGTISGTNDVGNGTYTATFTADVAGSATTINATIGGAAVTSSLPTLQVLVGPINPGNSIISLSSTSVASGSDITITLQGKDLNDNNLVAGGATVVFNQTGGTSTGTISATTDNSNGTYTAVFTGVTSGTPRTIGATINGSSVTTTLPAVTVNPGNSSEAQSQITVSAGAVNSGSSINVTLQAKDAAGNNHTTGGVTVVFNHSGGVSTGTLSGATDNGDGTYTATFTGVIAGAATTIGATMDGLAVTSSLPTVQVNPGPYSVTESTVAVSSPIVASGNSINVTLQAKDAAGNDLSSGGETVVFSRSGGASNGSFGVVSDNTDGTYTATFTGTTSGTSTTINATINAVSVTTSMPSVTVTPGAISVDDSLVTVSAGTVPSGSVITMTLQAIDGAGNTITSGGETVVFTRNGGVSTGSIGSTTDNADGTYTAVFTGLIAGAATNISATVGGVPLTTPAQAVTVTVGPISVAQSTVSLSNASVASGSTITATLTARDGAGNALITGGSTVTFNYSGGGSTVTFGSTSDNANGTYTAEVTGLLSGAATNIGSLIGATPVSTTLPTLTVTPGPYNVSISTISVSSTAVNSGNSIDVTIQAKDTAGNNILSGGETVTVGNSGGTSTGSFSAVTDNGNGTYTATFTGDNAGTPTTMTADINASAILSTPPTVQVNPAGVSVANSLITVSAGTVASGSDVTFTLQARDLNDNDLIAGGETVVFSYSGGTSTGTVGSTTDNGDGTYSATFTGLVSGTATNINATVNGSSVTTALPTVSVTPGPISLAESIVSVSSATVVSGASINLTLQAKDAAGNDITDDGETVVFSTSGGTSTGSVSATTDNNDGTYSATFTGTTSGTPTTIGATVGGANVTSTLPTVTVATAGYSLAKSIVSVSSPTVIAGNVITLTIDLKDLNDNDITTGGETVVFTHSAGGGVSTGTIGGTVDNNDGTYTATFTGNASGTAATINATIGGSNVTFAPLPTVTVNPGSLNLAQSDVTIAGSPANLQSNDNVTVTMTARDSQGNQLAAGGETVLFTFSSGSSTVSFGGVTDQGNGTYTAAMTGVLAGTAIEIGGTFGGAPITSARPSITIIPGAINVAQSVITVSSATIASGATSTVTLQARDANGNNLTAGGSTVAFNHANGTSTGTFSGTTDVSDGTYTAVFTGVASGTPTEIGATIGGSAVTTTKPTIDVNPGAVSVAQSAISVSSATVQSGSGIVLSLQARDAAGNNITVGGRAVLFSFTGGTSTGTVGGTTDNTDGTYTASFTGLVSGTATAITATIDAVAVTSPNPNVTVQPGTISTARSNITVSNTTVASGSVITLTLTARDANNNLIGSGSELVTFGNSGGASTGTIGSVTDVGDGNYTAEFTGLIAGTATTITAQINASAVTTPGAPNVAVTPGPINYAQTLVTVGSGTIASGTSTLVRLQARDTQGNNITSGGGTVVFAHSGGDATGNFSIVVDNGNGTYDSNFTGVTKGTATTITATFDTNSITSTLPTVAVSEGAISTTQSYVTVSSPTVASTNTITLTLNARDAAGNDITSGGATIAFSRTGGTSTGTIGSTTDNGNGTYVADFIGIIAGTATDIVGKVNAIDVTTARPGVTVTVGSSSTAQSTVTLSSTTVASGSAITATLQARDGNGNALTTGGQTVTFNCSSGSSTCSVGSTSYVGSGQYEAEITGVIAGTPTTVGADLDGSAVTSTLPTLTVGPGAISLAQSQITVSNTAVNSGNAITATLRARDAAGNNLTTGGGTVVFSHNNGTSTGSFGSTTDNTNGTYTSVFTGITSGTATEIDATYNAQAITSTSPQVTVNPGVISVATSVISVSSATVASGTDITVTLQAKDAAGNDLTTGGSTVTFSRAGGVSTGTFGGVSDNLDGTYTATFTGTTAGTATNITAQIGGSNVTSGNPTVTVNPGAASVAHSLVSVSSGTVVSGSVVTITLTARDANNNQLTAGGLAVTFGNSGGSSAGTYASQTDVGNGTYTIEFTGTTAGTATTVTATIGGSTVTTTMPTIDVNAGSISEDHSVVSVSATSLNSGNDITITLQARDANNNIITSGGELIAFSHSGGVSSGSIAATSDPGSGLYTAVFTGDTAGSATTIGATINALTVTTTMPQVTVNPGAFSLVQSLVSVSNVTVVSGAAITATMTLRDAAGNNLGTYDSGEIVTFETSGGASTGSFAAVSGSNGVYTSVFTGNVAGAATSFVGKINGSSVTSVAPNVTVVPGAPNLANSVISVSSATVQSGSNITLSLQPRDLNNNNIDDNTLSIAFTRAGGTSTGNIGTAAYQAGGVYEATFTGILAGTATNIGATIGGSTVTSTEPTVTVGVGAISLAQSIISVSSATVVSGNNVTLSLQARDLNGNTITTGGETVAFTNAGGVSDGSIGGTSDPGTGVYTAVFTGTTSGTATTINATINAAPSTYTPKPTVTVSTGPYSLSGTTVNISSGTITSGNSVNVTLQARDAAGNAITSSIGDPVTFNYSGGGSTVSFGSVTDNTDGTYTVAVTGVVAGSATTINALIDGNPVSSTMPTLTVNVGALNVANSATTITSSTVASGSAVTLTMTARDVNNNNIGSSVGVVSFTLESDGTSTGSIGSVTDVGDGTYTAVLTGNGSGTASSITTVAAGQTLTSTKPTIQVNPGPFSHTTSPVTASSTTVASGSNITVTLFARDAAGNSITTGGLTTVSFTNSTGSGVSDGTFGGAIDNSNGTYTAIFTAVTAGTVTQISAIENATTVTGTRPNVTVIPGPYSLAESFISVSSATINAGATSVVTLHLEDANGNALTAGGQTVSFDNSGGTADGSFSGYTDQGDGTHTITFTGETSGTPTTMTATVDSSAVTGSAASITVNPGAYTVANSVITASSTTVASAATITLSLQLRDAYNNTVPDGTQTVAFSYSGGGSTGNVSAASHITAGRYQADFEGLLAGAATTITATIDSVPVTSTAPQVQVVPGAYTLANSLVLLSSGSVVAGSQIVATIRLKDSNNNDLTTDGGVSSADFLLEGAGTSTGTFGSVTNNGNGTFTANFTGNVAGSAKQVRGNIDGSEITSAKPSVTVTTNAPQPTAIVRVNPAAAKGNDATPEFQIQGVSNGYTVNLYSDNCSTELVDGSATGATINLTATAQAGGSTVTYYANSEDAYGNKSNCVASGIAYEYDNSPPANTASAVVGTHTLLSDTSPLVSWAAVVASDFERYEVVIEQNSDGADIVANYDAGTGLSHTFTGLTMTECTLYQARVFSVDDVENISTGTVSGTFIYDETEPTGLTIDTIGSDGNVTKAPTITWSGVTDNCGVGEIDYIEMAIGTTSGGVDVFPYTNIGNVSTYQVENLSMIKDTDYYTSLRVYDKAGNLSDVVTSSAWQVVGTGRGYWTTTETVAGTNLNASESAFKWTDAVYDAGVFTHSLTSDPGTITLNTSGDYFVSFNVPTDLAPGGDRQTPEVQVRLNGVISSYLRAQHGYMREDSAHRDGSLNFNGLLTGVTAGDEITVTINGGTTAGTVTTPEARLFLEFYGPSKVVFNGTATDITSGSDIYVENPTPFEWTQDRVDAPFVHSDSTDPEEIGITEDGFYMVHTYVPTYSTDDRTSVLVEVQIDGVTVTGAKAAQAYIRAASGHNLSSVAWSGIIEITGASVGTPKIVTINTSADTYDEALGNERSYTDNSGLFGTKAAVMIEQINTTDEPVFVAELDQLVGGETDWNRTTSTALEWATPSETNASYYTHNDSGSNPEEITIETAGAYYLMYTDYLDLSNTTIRPNPDISIYLNGSKVPGAACRTHYMRKDNNAKYDGRPHRRSSCNLTWYFDDLSVDDIIHVETVATNQSGAIINESAPARLQLIRKGAKLFDPSAIADLEVWLDSSDTNTLYQLDSCATSATSTSDPVGCWQDKSGNANHFTESTNTPTVGTTGITFDGLNDILNNSGLNYTAASDKTIFVIAEVDTQSTDSGSCCRPLVSFVTGSTGAIYPWLAVTGDHYTPANNAIFGWSATATPIGATSTSPGDVMLFSASHDGTGNSWDAWGNGTAKATGETIPGSYTSTTSLNVGGDSGNSARHFAGSIYEVVIYDAILSTVERQNIEGYLACKWETRSSLNAGHPYYNVSDTSKIGCP